MLCSAFARYTIHRTSSDSSDPVDPVDPVDLVDPVDPVPFRIPHSAFRSVCNLRQSSRVLEKSAAEGGAGSCLKLEALGTSWDFPKYSEMSRVETVEMSQVEHTEGAGDVIQHRVTCHSAASCLPSSQAQQVFRIGLHLVPL